MYSQINTTYSTKPSEEVQIHYCAKQNVLQPNSKFPFLSKITVIFLRGTCGFRKPLDRML